MNLDDFPAPKEGFVITHGLVVADLDRSREFYRSLLGGQVLLEGAPVIMKVANTWLTLVTAGGPTDDKPGVSLRTPADPGRTSGFINVRVADIAKICEEWSAKSAEFLTEPKDHGGEIRAYVRDPDGHLIEVGQVTGLLDWPEGCRGARERQLPMQRQQAGLVPDAAGRQGGSVAGTC